MQPDVQRRVQRYGWDRGVGYYAAYWEPVLDRCARQTVSMAEPRIGGRVLDVACGGGAATQILAERVGPTGEVLGVDLSEKMTQRASDRLTGLGLDHATFARMGMEQLDLPDDSQDTVTCVLGLMYAPQTLVAVQEMARVLRQGGRCAIAVWGRRDRCGWSEVFPIVDRRVTTEVCPMFFAMGADEALVIAMEMAGFADIREERIFDVLRFPDAESVCMAMFAGGPASLAYSRFDEKTRDEVHSELLASVEQYRIGKAYDIPGEFVLAVGVKP
jgi:SAM-dependent methyltransferase